MSTQISPKYASKRWELTTCHARDSQSHNQQSLGSQHSKSNSVLSCDAYRAWCFGMVRGFALAIGLGLICHAESEKPFFEEDIPKQKMVMSRQRSRKTVQPSIDAHASSAEKVNNQLPTHQLNSPGSRLVLPSAQMKAPEVQEAGQSSDKSIQQQSASSQAFLEQESPQLPVDIIPEQGQAPSAYAQPMKIENKEKASSVSEKKPDIYAFNRVIQWVNEVSMNMFTYSGEHLHRDRHSAAQFFSPEAWQTVDQFLFHRADSPFLEMKQRHTTSRAMTLDWPIALHTDTTKRGKIWWIKVPVSVMLKEGKARKRAFFEVKLGVLPIKEGKEVRFIAEDVFIKQVNMPQHKQVRGHRNAR